MIRKTIPHYIIVLAATPAPVIAAAARENKDTKGIIIACHVDEYDVDEKLKQAFQSHSLPDKMGYVSAVLEYQEDTARTLAPLICREKKRRRWEKLYTPPRKSNNRFK